MIISLIQRVAEGIDLLIQEEKIRKEDRIVLYGLDR